MLPLSTVTRVLLLKIKRNTSVGGRSMTDSGHLGNIFSVILCFSAMHFMFIVCISCIVLSWPQHKLQVQEQNVQIKLSSSIYFCSCQVMTAESTPEEFREAWRRLKLSSGLRKAVYLLVLWRLQQLANAHRFEKTARRENCYLCANMPGRRCMLPAE